jgi:hypothetical protein
MPKLTMNQGQFLLAFLTQKHAPEEDGRHDIEELARTIYQIEQDSKAIVFGFPSRERIFNDDFVGTLKELESYGFVQIDSSNPHLTLTQLGRKFGETFRLPSYVNTQI